MVLNVYGGTSVLALPHPAGPHVVEAAPATNEITRTATIRDGLRDAIAHGESSTGRAAEGALEDVAFLASGSCERQKLGTCYAKHGLLHQAGQLWKRGPNPPW